MKGVIPRTLMLALVAFLLVPPAVASPRTEYRVYVGGVGLLSLPLCGGAGSTSLLGVCFALQSDDANVSFLIQEDVQVGSVIGTAYFVDAAGAQVGASTPFCDASPVIAIPPTAVAARVTLGTLPYVTDLPGCLPGVATTGVVAATFY